MLTRLRNRLNRKVERTQHQAIRLISFRQVYRELRDQNRYRRLFTEQDSIQLSAEQVAAATSHAKETLVVAGAGSGKTSLLLGRAHYLVQSGRAKPDEILMLAYNKDAAAELAKRAQAMGLPVPAKTFHSFGKSVLGSDSVTFTSEASIASELRKFLDELDGKLKHHLVIFFERELVAKKEFTEFKNLSEYAAYIRGGIPKTLRGERVKSHGEWLIANFLFVNSVEYQYEAPYGSRESGTQHKPDFCITQGDRPIYVEYFGVDLQGNVAPWVNRGAYLNTIRWKKQIHNTNKTELIELTYGDLQEDKLIARLKQALDKKGVRTKPRTPTEILDSAQDVGYQSRFLDIVKQFLNHIRANKTDLRELKKLEGLSSRDKAFLDIFQAFLTAYEAELETRAQPDFPELIYGATERIQNGSYSEGFSHLLIDEFQDISRDRFRLIQAMLDSKPGLEVTYVGDDWQSIYRFSGSDITIMKDLSSPRRNRRRLDLTTTYRLPQVIADASSHFIQRNPLQLKKSITSKAATAHSGAIKFHWDTVEQDHQANVLQVIERIGRDSLDPALSLKVLTRYKDNRPGHNRQSARSFLQEHWEGPVDVSTIHAAKGLEADYVIVTDLMQDNRGFPSTIEDDPVLRLVLPEKDLYLHGEERRLFYVALTRARREVHLICPIATPSLFAQELLNKGIGQHLGLDEQKVPRCPVCESGRLITSPKSYGSKCSNSPHCDFFAPYCRECKKRMLVSINPEYRYECRDHPDAVWPVCPSCNWGVLITRTNSFTGQPFASCHTWARTRCVGKSKPYAQPRRAPSVTSSGR